MKGKKQIKLNDKVVSESGFIVSNIDDEIIMMSIKREKYFGLDSVASEIWKMLKTPLVVGDIVAQLADQYDSGEEKISEDVLRFLNILLKEGMIKVVH